MVYICPEPRKVELAGGSATQPGLFHVARKAVFLAPPKKPTPPPPPAPPPLSSPESDTAGHVQETGIVSKIYLLV